MLNTLSLAELEEAAALYTSNTVSSSSLPGLFLNNGINAHSKAPEVISGLNESITIQLTKEKLAQEYETRLSELDTAWRNKYQSLVERSSLSSQSLQMTQLAALDAKVKAVKNKYEKKLLKIEDTMSSALQKNREEVLATHAALQESRNSVKDLQLRFQQREEQYREELTLKDLRLNKLLSEMSNYSELSRRLDRWETISKALATAVIQTCSTVESLPTSRKILEAVFPDFDPDSRAGIAASKAKVTIGKKGLIQCLNLSKKIIQRFKLEHEDDEDNAIIADVLDTDDDSDGELAVNF